MSTHHSLRSVVDRHRASKPDAALPVLLLAAGLTVIASIILLAFSWPAVNSTPKNIPVVVAPPAAAAQIQAGLAGTPAAGALTITPVADEAAARQSLLRQDAYGAIVVGSQGPTVLKAGAASPMVSGLMDQLAVMLQSHAAGTPVPTAQDLVPLNRDDSRGFGFAAGALPMTIAGLLVGGAFGLLVRRSAIRLIGVMAASLLTGLSFAGLLQLLGILSGRYLGESAVVAVAVAAVGTVVAALTGRLGLRGLSLSALIFVLLGVPLSGVASAPQILPKFWGSFGQWLPAGAGGSLLRTVAYFPSASFGPALWVLVGWVLVGLMIAAVPARPTTTRTVEPRLAAVSA